MTYYSKLKILHHKKKLDTLTSRTPITAPIHIRIKPTNVCNHRCSYCSYQNSYGQLGKDMKKADQIPYLKLKQIMSNCEDMGVKAITFSGGGEPLLYPNFYHIIKGTSLDIAVLTNGIFLRDKLAAILAHKATWIRISVDGYDPASYSEYRKCSIGDFYLLQSNVKMFKKLRQKCLLGVNIIIDERNVSHLADMVKMWKDLGVDNIKLSPAIISNSSQVNNAYHSRIMDLFDSQLSQVDMTNVYNSYHLQLGGFEKTYTWCPYVQILPIIGADCRVYTCHDKAYNLTNGVLGDIRKISFKRFWFKNKDKFYKINPAVDCNHHCITDNTNKLILEYLSIKHKEFV